jgi:hypothetical protein
VSVNLNVPWLTFIGGCSVTLSLAVLEPLRATDVGDTEQVECGGPPLQLSATFPLKLLTDASAMAYVATWPAGIVCDEGVTFRLKSVTEKLSVTGGAARYVALPAWVA